jgi:hypothetical protein
VHCFAKLQQSGKPADADHARLSRGIEAICRQRDTLHGQFHVPFGSTCVASDPPVAGNRHVCSANAFLVMMPPLSIAGFHAPALPPVHFSRDIQL